MQFPDCYEEAVIKLVHHATLKEGELSQRVISYFRDRFVPGEIALASRDGLEKRCKIVTAVDTITAHDCKPKSLATLLLVGCWLIQMNGQRADSVLFCCASTPLENAVTLPVLMQPRQLARLQPSCRQTRMMSIGLSGLRMVGRAFWDGATSFVRRSLWHEQYSSPGYTLQQLRKLSM